MPTFIPPTDPRVYWSDRSDEGILSFLTPGPRGRNIYKLVNGAYTEYQPGDMDTVAVLYHGGHIHPVTDDEAAALTAAGYGAYIS